MMECVLQKIQDEAEAIDSTTVANTTVVSGTVENYS